MIRANRVERVRFAAVALPLLVATGWRIGRRARRLPLDELVAELRAPRRHRLSPALARPELLAGTVERCLPWLPPRRFGPCLRRALLLLDLWSRCGLQPMLHLGFRPGAAELRGHAWLTARSADGGTLRVSGPLEFQPTFEL